ncbi:MAG: hypothetical protein LBO06_05300 [Bacteroidales bacterium]|jgi:hypothetical protein|nr:hypothetical protein [Bacteroidales bacterium]
MSYSNDLQQLIKDILSHKSISFVGMEKNTGKTEALNFVLRSLSASSLRIAITSVGLDGEKQDYIFSTSKPEITIYPKTTFVTAENLYRTRQITSSIKDISLQMTALGRLITATAITKGRVILAGPSNTSSLRQLIATLLEDNDICLIDGALSRLSVGSPSVTDAMVLSTGAAVSMNMETVVSKTEFVYRMTQLEAINEPLRSRLNSIQSGIYAIDGNNPVALSIPSLLVLEKYKDILFSCGNRLFISGILTNSLLSFLLTQRDISSIELIISDFTKIFSSIQLTYSFLQRGGNLRVVTPTNLIGITINPVAPTGFRFDATRLQNAIAERVSVPVFNVK